MTLTGVTVNVRDGNRRTHYRVLDFFPEGEQFFEDKGFGYGFARCDDWVLVDFIKRQLRGPNVAWRMARFWVNPPSQWLVHLVSVLYGMGLATSKGAMFFGYGGCIVTPHMLRIKRCVIHDLDTTIGETVGVIARSFNAGEVIPTLANNPTRALAQLNPL